MSQSLLNVTHEYDVEVPMRDGVLLRGTLFRPDASGQFPVLLVRTPYGTIRAGYERYVRLGYIVYAQDCRGRYTSDGEHRVFTRDDHGEDLDGYDTVEWLAAQPWCNGKVGELGRSYLGFTSWMTASAKPPHLVAINAETIPPEMADVDFTGGSFRPARRVHWWLNAIAPDWRRRLKMPPPHTMAEAGEIWNSQTHVHWLSLLPWVEVANHLPEPLATDVADWFKNPARRNWQFEKNVYPQLEIPNLDVVGWYDHCNASLDHLMGMQQHGGSELARQQTKVLIGPWNHNSQGQRQLGDVDFGANAEVDMIDLRVQWFDHWIKGIDNGVQDWPAVRYFEMGRNEWRDTETWPPPSEPQEWYIGGTVTTAQGTLAPTKSTFDSKDCYSYDPHDPVPTLWPPQLFTLVSNRRKLEHREDILRYRSEPLSEPVTIAGNPEVTLFAASDALDTDFFVWLVDEAPDGTALEISSGMIRARHRRGLDQDDLLTPNEPTEFHLILRPTANCFLPGHRIRLEISSSDFPNFDRNHNTGGDDLRETELRAAQQTVLHGGEFATHVVLPLMNS